LGFKNVECGIQNTGDKKQITEILVYSKGEVRTLKCCIVLQNTGLKHSAAGNQCRHKILNNKYDYEQCWRPLTFWCGSAGPDSFLP
jgi:hypothetical protein